MQQSNFGRNTLLSFQCAVMAVAHFEVCDCRVYLWGMRWVVLTGIHTHRWRCGRRQLRLVVQVLVAEVSLATTEEHLRGDIFLNTRLLVVAGLVVQPTPTFLHLNLPRYVPPEGVAVCPLAVHRCNARLFSHIAVLTLCLTLDWVIVDAPGGGNINPSRRRHPTCWFCQYSNNIRHSQFKLVQVSLNLTFFRLRQGFKKSNTYF